MSLTVLLHALRENGECILGDGNDMCIESLEKAIKMIEYFHFDDAMRLYDLINDLNETNWKKYEDEIELLERMRLAAIGVKQNEA